MLLCFKLWSVGSSFRFIFWSHRVYPKASDYEALVPWIFSLHCFIFRSLRVSPIASSYEALGVKWPVPLYCMELSRGPSNIQTPWTADRTAGPSGRILAAPGPFWTRLVSFWPVEVEESFLGRWVRAHIWAPKVGTSGDKKVRIKNIKKKKKSKSTLLDVAFHNDSEKKGPMTLGRQKRPEKWLLKRIFF